SLDETLTSWNLHKIHTAKNKSPQAIYELSQEKAINRGYWTGNPNNDFGTVSHPSYGKDASEPLPPLDELIDDHEAPDYMEPVDVAAERDSEIFLNHNHEVEEMKAAFGNFDYPADDGNWGINTYCRVV
ncbi:hypothetical protein B0H14DRAFT_2311466, partial [Mycena olivaceomarginata]